MNNEKKPSGPGRARRACSTTAVAALLLAVAACAGLTPEANNLSPSGDSTTAARRGLPPESVEQLGEPSVVARTGHAFSVLELAAILEAARDPGEAPAETIAALEPVPGAAAPTDLLERIRLGFVLDTSEDESKAREVAWFARNEAYLGRVFGRGEDFLYYIVGELEARGMPLDLALLPIVESAFDPFAYSHGRASGLWQIIPGTGTRLGLTQNWWFDGRRDVLESTRAALDYLEQLHAMFDGDWLLAVAGYNSGEGNVARALRRAEANGRSKDFWGIRSYLPAETRTYVPRLLAIRDLVADPASHGIELPPVPNEAKLAVVETGGQIDMALAAELADLEIDRLYGLNAGVNRWATDPDGPHRLVVPLAHAEPFRTALAALGDRERVQWTRHRIKQGDTLGGLAEQYQTTVAVLREVNALRGNTIRAGDYLMIPNALQSLASYSQSADERAARRQGATQEGQRREHVVRSGESLWSISQRYGVGVRELASWNAMAPGDVLSVGRALVVWTDGPPEGATAVALAATAATAAAATAADAPAPAALVSTAAASERIQRVTYTVRRGDSLSSIATRFRVTVGKLVEWNKVSTDKYLQPGQQLVVFVDVTAQSG